MGRACACALGCFCSMAREGEAGGKRGAIVRRRRRRREEEEIQNLKGARRFLKRWDQHAVALRQP